MQILSKQLSLLSDIAKREKLDFELFCKYHDHILSDNHQGSVRDGSIVRCEVFVPLLGNNSKLAIDIIGAYWDSIYRIEFSGVTNVQYDKELYRFPEIASIELTDAEGGNRKFIMKAFYVNVTAEICFKCAEIEKLTLKKAVTRDEIKGRENY